MGRNIGRIGGFNRGEQRIKLLTFVAAKGFRVRIQCFIVHKQGILGWVKVCLARDSDKITEQPTSGNPTVPAGEGVIFFRPCVLHGVRIVFQIRRLGIFKPCGEPCRVHSIVELLHMIKEGLYPQVGYAGILQKFGKKILCIRIC